VHLQGPAIHDLVAAQPGLPAPQIAQITKRDAIATPKSSAKT